MRLVPGQRRIEISAGAFALFGGSRAVGRHGRWRAEVGREWHVALQREKSAAEGWRFEVGVKTFWIENGWTLAVDGRIDQLREDGEEILVREVKTVGESLPRPEEFWQEERRHFFVQLALYCLGLRQQPENAGKKVRGGIAVGGARNGNATVADAGGTRGDLDCAGGTGAGAMGRIALAKPGAVGAFAVPAALCGDASRVADCARGIGAAG